VLIVTTSDHVAMPLPEKHPFPRNKYALARERVAAISDERGIVLREAPAATDEELLRVHTADYVARVRGGLLTDREQREIGFPWSEGLVARSLHSTGATLAAARAVFAGLSTGAPVWGAHLAGGTHHAFADRGQGFCVFNDVAVAIRAMQAQGAFDRAIVIDLDVHQGNGTAAIFAEDPNVFTLSVHGAKNFPLRKETSDLDVTLDDGAGDDDYLPLVRGALDEAWRRFDPQAVFYIAGADPYVADRYGRMALTKRGLRERDRMVANDCRDRGLPLVAAMGGGYARNVDDVAEIYATTIEVLAEHAPMDSVAQGSAPA
jgi:acetoin utilization deacetylase AcuC-like enzyme